MNSYLFLGWLLVVLQIFDGLTTYGILRSPGGTEGNLFLKKFFSIFGVIPGIIISKLVSIFLVFLLVMAEQPMVLLILNVIFLITIFWNIYIIRKLNSSI